MESVHLVPIEDIRSVVVPCRVAEPVGTDELLPALDGLRLGCI